MGRQYANPPVVEAVCEFRLTQSTHWDLTIPGLFYEKVKDEFPQKEQRMVQEVELKQSPQGFQQQIHTSERMLLFKADKKKFVQLGPRLLVINVLKPYPSWIGFRSLIESAWEGLSSVVEIKSLERIGLRYINRIELPVKNGSANLESYFQFFPHVGPKLPQVMDSFIVGVESPYDDERDRCRLQLSAAPDFKENNAVMLDIDYFLAQPEAVEASEAMKWIEKAHDRVEEIFEGSITDSLRKIFEEV